jgi:hypothetical protein
MRKTEWSNLERNGTMEQRILVSELLIEIMRGNVTLDTEVKICGDLPDQQHVFRVTNKDTGQVYYGARNDPRFFRRQIIAELNGDNKLLVENIRAYGLDRFTWETVQICESELEAKVARNELIRKAQREDKSLNGEI